MQATLRVGGPRKARALDLRDLRVAGTAMVGLAAVWPLLPLHPGFACPLRMVTGIPCPLCGMTTSMVDTVHLQLNEAFAANFGGPLAVGFALWLVLGRPRRVKIHPTLVALLLLAMWLFELRRFAVL